MNRISIFDSPLLLGFEDYWENMFDKITQNASENYPPYNITRLSDEDIEIEVAVAGFKLSDLNVKQEKNRLVISGNKLDKADGNEVGSYIHRGIASRQFERVFVLAEDVKVKSANLEDGLLTVNLFRERKKDEAREIKISASAQRKLSDGKLGSSVEKK